jgi:hypothetical protein
MNGYVDVAHYTRKVGRAIELCALHKNDTCDGYGTNLAANRATLEHLQRSRKTLDRYMELHSRDLADLRREVRETQSFRDRLPPPGGLATHLAEEMIFRLKKLHK